MKSLLLGAAPTHHSVNITVGASQRGFYKTYGWSAVDSVVDVDLIGAIDQIPYWVYNGPYIGSKAALVCFVEIWGSLLDEDGQYTDEVDPNYFIKSIVAFKALTDPASVVIYDLAVDVNGTNRISALDIDVNHWRIQDCLLDYPLGILGNQNLELTFRPNYDGVIGPNDITK